MVMVAISRSIGPKKVPEDLERICREVKEKLGKAWGEGEGKILLRTTALVIAEIVWTCESFYRAK